MDDETVTAADRRGWSTPRVEVVESADESHRHRVTRLALAAHHGIME